MGAFGIQGRFFYRIDLEKRGSFDHLLRKVDEVLDLSKLGRSWRRKGWIPPDDPRGWFQSIAVIA